MDKEQVLRRRRDLIAEISGKMVDCNLSQKEMAEMVGASPSQISLWMSSDRNIWLDTYIKLCLACEEKATAGVDGYGAAGESDVLEEPVIGYGGEASMGAMIRQYLRRRDMSQKELADIVGTSQSRISEYIRGAVIPSIGVTARICLALDIDRDEFLKACAKL